MSGSMEDDESGATGSVVTRNSDRSFTRPRRAMTAMGTDDENVNEREFLLVRLNGSSSRKREIWPFAAICVVPEPKSCPWSFVKKNETVAAVEFGLAIAIP